jgi:hypothetical protein
MTTLHDMIEEIKQELDKGVDIEEIRDNSGGWIDGHLPVYNNLIIEEWKQMPSDYDNRGVEELGLPSQINIINLMNLDLYIYYGDLFAQALDRVKSE